MNSIISIVGVVLKGKENYNEWYRKIKHTLISNEFWNGICEGEGDNAPKNPTWGKEISIWENKNSKAYALIAMLVNEEVSCYISPFSNAYEVLKNFKELYDSHSKLEVVQLMIKLFNIDLKNDDALSLASEVRSIMHELKFSCIETYIPLIYYVKELYPTYSHYLESLQGSGKLKEITFDSLEKKFV